MESDPGAAYWGPDYWGPDYWGTDYWAEAAAEAATYAQVSYRWRNDDGGLGAPP